MKLPWVSRALYEMALQQVEELKAANAQLLELALTKQAAPVAAEKDEDQPPPTRRRLVKEIRETAEKEMREKAAASGKNKK